MQPGSGERCSSSPVIRRTSSLDTIYLKGQWPRDAKGQGYTYCGSPLVDKATQTPDEWPEESPRGYRRPTSTGSGEPFERIIRQRLQRTNKENSRERSSGGAPRQSPIPGDHKVLPSASLTPARPPPVPVPHINKPLVPRMRSSAEGFNPEVEKLVHRSSGQELMDWECEKNNVVPMMMQSREPTPDGHRAPVAELLRTNTRSVDTQTPSTQEYADSSQSSGPSSRCQSTSPPDLAMDTSQPLSRFDGVLDVQERDGSKCSSPDLGTSPHINRFLAREPPDGCEKVNLRTVEEDRKSGCFDVEMCVFKGRHIEIKPSIGSAFCPLPSKHGLIQNDLHHVPDNEEPYAGSPMVLQCQVMASNVSPTEKDTIPQQTQTE